MRTRSPRGPGPARPPASRVLLLLLPLALVLLTTTAPACIAAPDEPAEAAPESVPESAAAEETPPLVGDVTRAEIEAHEPSWVAAQVEADVDAEAARALLDVEPGAAVTIFLGTWCSDSKRELAHLWRAFDEAGIDPSGEMGTEPPFAVRYVAVDRDKEEPAGRAAAAGIGYVPTFVVRRGGEEVGRMVEVSPNGIERDLLALLTGEATGVVSAREDLGDPGEAAVGGEAAGGGSSDDAEADSGGAADAATGGGAPGAGEAASR